MKKLCKIQKFFQNFEDVDYEELQDGKKSYQYIKEKLVKGKKYMYF